MHLPALVLVRHLDWLDHTKARPLVIEFISSEVEEHQKQGTAGRMILEEDCSVYDTRTLFFCEIVWRRV